MKRKSLRPGLLVQIVVLLLFIPALIILGRSETRSQAATSSLGLTGSSGYDGGDRGAGGDDDIAGSMTFSPNEGPGGPILVVNAADNRFSNYTMEILRAEGLNEFATENISSLTSTILSRYDIVILGEMPLDEYQVGMFSNWVSEGGILVSYRPCEGLAPLMGLSPEPGELRDKYLLIHDMQGPGQGIVHETMQFHGPASLYKLTGATALATLYTDAFTATNYPAVASREVGKRGGKAIAFAFDLARSVVYTRQGNPEWAGQKRDGEIDPIRSDDLFYPNWIDFNKVSIPQADEQQRLLANLLVLSNMEHKPLPRFWYLPRDLKAAVVMTGDNHTANGTAERFYQYMSLGPNTAEDVADWKAVRATSYIYPDMPISPEQANFFQQQGFEIALHTNTGCTDYTPASLKRDFYEELKRFSSSYPGLIRPATNRSHCLNWSDWASTPRVELQNGIRLDATYYYWPESWMKNRPGMFTGSGIPMRFADHDGALIDVYQLPTQMTDETNMQYASFCNSLLDHAIGPEGYYGIFCANMHTDHPSSEGSDAIIASAQARGIPVISARQLLNWLDGRNNSFFSNLSWKHHELQFDVTVHEGARNLRAMLPLFGDKTKLVSISNNGHPLPLTIEYIKGIAYAFFSPLEGNSHYIASYEKRGNTRDDPHFGLASSGKTSPVDTDRPANGLFVKVVPNPGIGYFNLVTSSQSADPISIKIKDQRGKTIESLNNVPATGILRIGQEWKHGKYFIELGQGDQHRTEQIEKVY